MKQTRSCLFFNRLHSRRLCLRTFHHLTRSSFEIRSREQILSFRFTFKIICESRNEFRVNAHQTREFAGLPKTLLLVQIVFDCEVENFYFCERSSAFELKEK